MTTEELLNSEFLKQFKDSKDFGKFMDQLYKRGVESMLEGEIEAHLGYPKHAQNTPKTPQTIIHVTVTEKRK